MRPMNSNILIATMQQREEEHLGITIPNTIKLGYGVGIVVAVHEGTALPDGTVIPCKLAVGNMVAYHANSGVEYIAKGQPCRLMAETYIIAVLQEKWEDGEVEIEGADNVVSIVGDEAPE